MNVFKELPQASQKEQINEAIRCILSNNVSGIGHFIEMGGRFPATYKMMPFELFFSIHFNADVANVVLPSKKKWTFLPILSDILKKTDVLPDPTLKDWSLFVTKSVSKDELESLYKVCLSSAPIKNDYQKNVLLHLIKGMRQHFGASVKELDQHMLGSKKMRHNILQQLILLQDQKLWSDFMPNWVAADLTKLVAMPPKNKMWFTANVMNFLVKQTKSSAYAFLWDNVATSLSLANKEFDFFYKKHFGMAKSGEDFFETHDPNRWLSLLNSLKSYKKTESLNLSWWQNVQMVGMHDVSNVLPKTPPFVYRSLEHMQVLNANRETIRKISVKEIKTPTDAFLFSHLPVAVLKAALLNKELADWQDNNGNNMGHYIVCCSPTISLDFLKNAIKTVPNWFFQRNKKDLGVFQLLEESGEVSSEDLIALNQLLLEKEVKKMPSKSRGKRLL